MTERILLANPPTTRWGKTTAYVVTCYYGSSPELIQQWSLATLRGIMSQYFKVGDLVRKRAGYEYPGIIVSVFTTRAGAVRYVVEADHPGFAGMLHIFNGEQLEPRA
jgi:hypothetical protein